MVNVRPPHRRYLDGLAVRVRTDLLDRVALVGFTDGEITHAATPANVQPEHPLGGRCVRIPRPQCRLSAISRQARRSAGQIDGLGKLEVANRKPGRLLDLHEEYLDPDGNAEFDLHPARALRAERRVETDSRQCDPEDSCFEAGVDTQAKVVHRVAGSVRRHNGPHPEARITAEPERTGPDRNPTRQTDVEVPVRIQETVTVEGGYPEEVDRRIEIEPPAAVNHVNPEAGIEFQYLQDRNAAVKIEQERVGGHSETRGIRRVDLERTAGVDLEDRDIGADRHVKPQHKPRIGAVDHRRGTVGLECKGLEAQRELQPELDRRFLGVNQELRKAAALGKAQEVDAAVDAYTQARSDGKAPDRLAAAGGVDRHEGAAAERYPDVPAKPGIQCECGPKHEPS